MRGALPRKGAIFFLKNSVLTGKSQQENSMKITKNLKILCLVLAFAVSIAGFALCYHSAPAAYAAEQETTNFFSFREAEGTSASKATLNGSDLVLSVHDKTDATFIRKLVISDFSMAFQASAFDSLTFTFTSDSPMVTSEETVENVLKLTVEGGRLYAVVNPEEDEMGIEICAFAADSTEIALSVADLEVSVNSVWVGTFDAVRKYDKQLADLAFTVAGGADVTITVNEINTQTFAQDEDGKFTDIVPQTVALRDDFFNEVDGENVKIYGYKYRMTYTLYGVLPTAEYNVSTSDLSVKPAEADASAMTYLSESSTKYLIFNRLGSFSFDVVSGEGEEEVVYGTYTVSVIKDTEKPSYDLTASEAIEKFKADLADAVYEDKDSGEYIQLGSSEYLSLPSMEGFVKGNGCSYNALSYTVVWKSDQTTGTSSTWRIPVASAGDYTFYVKFYKSYNEDLTMDDEDFEEGGIYEDMVFRFNVQDNNKPVTISAPTSQEAAYVGVSYTAKSFTITGVEYESTYKLFYNKNNSDPDADGWLEITPSSELDADDDNYETFSTIAYNGRLTFTPHALGYYKIELTATKKLTGLSADSYTIIKVEEKNKTVTVPSDWLENNVWTVVFLGLGTLCLIGIIVVLCIKPKEETEPAQKPKDKK